MRPRSAFLTLVCLSLVPTLAGAAPKPVQTLPRVLPLAEAKEKEAALFKEVKVAEGFEATLFAAPPAVNYPVFVAAAPDGTLYVSSDGNGSLGREPGLGRVLRLRDTDDDGRADEVKVFVDNVDSPRALLAHRAQARRKGPAGGSPGWAGFCACGTRTTTGGRTR